MNYRSVADLNDAILSNIHKLPQDVDAIVGVPRSGLLAANLMCLALNVPMTDVDNFLAGRLLATGDTRKCKDGYCQDTTKMRTVVVVDDSINSGRSMEKTRERFKDLAGDTNFIFCAVFGLDKKHTFADIVFEQVPLPRMFQWNLMHHPQLEECCVDIDGVLCMDPTSEENDDGTAYKNFLANATPLLSTSGRIGALVTSRLEKYRAETERWMEKNNIQYNTLHMLDLPSQKERIERGAHGRFKARIYKESNAILFIESEHEQAVEIARLSGKPVLCIATQHIIYPSFSSIETLKNLPQRLRRQSGIYIRRRIRGMIQAAFGSRGVDLVKKVTQSGLPPK